ncbi:AbrB/MazE/SpoVT family DNA-binding domain-containing protein [Desulfonatronum parangueonense]
MESNITFEGTVQQWGNSLGLRITRTVGDLARIKKGTRVRLEVTEDGLLVRPIVDDARTYSEKELLAGLTPFKAHADEVPNLLETEQDA